MKNFWQALVIAVVLPSIAGAQDQVIPKTGTPVSGSIVGITPTEVTVEARGKTVKFPVNELRRVSFREDPTDLKRARDKILVGQIASGLADLRKVDVASIRRKEVKADLQFYLAWTQGRLALSEGGDKSAATAAVLNFAKGNPTSFHFLQAAELLGDLSVAQEKYDDAVKYYRAIATKSPWPDYKIRASILEARARMAQNDFEQAKGLFEKVSEYAADTEAAKRQKTLAAIGETICLVELGGTDEAQQKIEQIIRDSDPDDSELQGRAYNALGRCHAKADRPQDALLAYLHVDILFASTPDVHAESLYHLGNLWEVVKKADRAAATRRVLAERYGGSKWARTN